MAPDSLTISDNIKDVDNFLRFDTNNPPPNVSIRILQPSKRTKSKTHEAFDLLKICVSVSEVSTLFTLKACKKCPSSKRKVYEVSTNVTNLQTHLENDHKDSAPDKDQRSILLWTKTRPALVVPAEIQTTLTNYLIKLVVSEALSLRLVDSQHFREFVNKLCPGYKVPSRSTLTRKIVDLYFRIRKNVAEFFDDFEISLSLDVWTSVNNEPYLGVTGHYIDHHFCLKSAVIDFFPFAHPHTGERIAFIVNRMIEEKKLRVLSITTDSGSNVTCALDFLTAKRPIIHHRCMAHIINLGVKSALEKLKIPLQKIRDFAQHLKRSSLAKQDFEDAISCLFAEYSPTIIQDVVTRWGSTYEMIKSYLEKQRAVNLFLTDSDDAELRDLVLTRGELTTLELICDFLKVFNDCTTFLSSVKIVTISLLIYVMRQLIHHCKNFCPNRRLPDGHVVKLSAQACLGVFTSYHESVFSMASYAATILDPRFKNTLMPEELRCEENLKTFKSLFEQYKTEMQPVAEQLDQDLFLTSLMAGIAPVQPQTTELEIYLSSPTSSLQQDPLLWWRDHKESFPGLSKMARSYLAQQATSVDVERLFSKAGRFATTSRNRLGYDSLEALVVLQSWLSSGLIKEDDWI
ncbi:hypothetical protein RCL1_003158 [Eukaryota sp. TZLM3-RCL]